MTLTSRKATVTKIVQIIARVEFKSDSRKVVYLVRSSKGDATYQTTLFDGRATSCTCPAMKPCYHMVQLERSEQARALPESEWRIVPATLDSFLVEYKPVGTYTWQIARNIPAMHYDACEEYVSGNEQKRGEIVAAFQAECEALWREQRAQEVADLEAMLSDDDESYEQWKIKHGLDQPMTREEYNAEFDPHGWNL